MVSITTILMIFAVLSSLIVIYILLRNFGMEPIPYISTPLDYVINRPFKVVSSAIDSIKGKNRPTYYLDKESGWHTFKNRCKATGTERLYTGYDARAIERHLNNKNTKKSDYVGYDLKAPKGTYRVNNRAIQVVTIRIDTLKDLTKEERVHETAAIYSATKSSIDDGQVVILEMNGNSYDREIYWKDKSGYHIDARRYHRDSNNRIETDNDDRLKSEHAYANSGYIFTATGLVEKEMGMKTLVGEGSKNMAKSWKMLEAEEKAKKAKEK